jgi:hypothetical protein
MWIAIKSIGIQNRNLFDLQGLTDDRRTAGLTHTHQQLFVIAHFFQRNLHHDGEGKDLSQHPLDLHDPDGFLTTFIFVREAFVGLQEFHNKRMVEN